MCDRPCFRMNGHTKTEFLRIVNREDEFFDRVYRRKKGDTGVPPGKIRPKDLEGWMYFLGAYWV